MFCLILLIYAAPCAKPIHFNDIINSHSVWLVCPKPEQMHSVCIVAVLRCFCLANSFCVSLSFDTLRHSLLVLSSLFFTSIQQIFGCNLTAPVLRIGFQHSRTLWCLFILCDKTLYCLLRNVTRLTYDANKLNAQITHICTVGREEKGLFSSFFVTLSCISTCCERKRDRPGWKRLKYTALGLCFQTT